MVSSQISDNWNISLAQAVGGAVPFLLYTHVLMFRPRQDSPEVTGTASTFPMSTSSISRSTLTPSASTSTSTSHHNSDAGAIAGGVIGSLLVVALIIGIVARSIIRRRRARSAPSTTYLSLHGSDFEHWQPMPFPPTIETPRLYVSVSLFLSFAQRRKV